MLVAEIRRIIETSPLSEKADEVMDLVRPALRLRARQVDLETLPPGASRMGGLPDLPPELPWPENRGRPMEFLAQVDLSAAASVFLPSEMPETGWLTVFCDLEGQKGYVGESPARRVLYFEGNAKALDRRPPPEPRVTIRERPGWFSRVFLGRVGEVTPPAPVALFECCAVEFEREDCLPDPIELAGEFGPDDEEAQEDAWYFLNDRFNSLDDRPYHRIGGYPMLIQSDREEYLGWRFLLQVDSDEEGPNWMWGDMGRLYFWVLWEDLEARDFDNVRCICEFY